MSGTDTAIAELTEPATGDRACRAARRCRT